MNLLIVNMFSIYRPIPVMQFRNHRTRKILKGAEQVGNRLRYEFGRFEARRNEEYTCELKNTFGQTSKKTAYIKMEGIAMILMPVSMNCLLSIFISPLTPNKYNHSFEHNLIE